MGFHLYFWVSVFFFLIPCLADALKLSGGFLLFILYIFFSVCDGEWFVDFPKLVLDAGEFSEVGFRRGNGICGARDSNSLC